MWTIWQRFATADDVTATRGGAVVANSTSGELYSIDPTSQSVPLTIGDGWTGPAAVAALPDDSALVVADGNGHLWETDPGDASPRDARPLGRGFGVVAQLVAPTSQVVYVLARPAPRPTRPAGPAAPMPLGPPSRYRLVRVDRAGTGAATLATNLVDAGGFTVRTDESTAYVTSTGLGTITAVDLVTGERSVVATGLDTPGRCTWLDEAAGLMVVIEAGGLALVDVVGRVARSFGGCPGTPRSVARSGGLVVVAAGDFLVTADVAGLQMANVVLTVPSTPLYRGSYARVGVSLGQSGLSFEDVDVDVLEGPEFAGFSRSLDQGMDPTHPQAMLLAGPYPGTYTVRARDHSGADLAMSSVEITDQWTSPDGPPMAFTGVHRVYSSGGTWGSLFNGVFPFDFSFGAAAVTGIRRVALIFVSTSDVALPLGTDTTYRNALAGGVTNTPDGVTRSVAAYYAELSDGRLAVVPAGEAAVTLPKKWAEYTATFSATDKRFQAKGDLIADAMWHAQNTIDFTFVDSAVFVVASPNGGVALPPPTPADPPGAAQFCWPVASSGTYVLTQPTPPLTLRWWWKSLPWVVMPAEWESLDSRRAFETLTHEIGHTLGLPDLYGDPREINGYDPMVNETRLPSFCLPHQALLGWIALGDVRIYNFRFENPVDQTITLTATEKLGAAGPPTGERAGAVIEVADGWRYYFEYRSRQNRTPSDLDVTQVADQGMPEDRRVIGSDVKAGWYKPPVARRPIRLLPDDGDGQGPVLSVGEDYVELDATGNATFTLDVLSADDDRASVRVRYQPVPTPEPPWPNGPDPFIRPWPGGDNWRSPDIQVTNSLNLPDIPWAGHVNTITAVVGNSGVIAATDVRVGFWVKDFTVSDAGPETFLGWAVPASVPAGGKATFSMNWIPPDMPGFLGGPLGFAHFCVVVRIAPHVQGSPPRGEANPDNNQAQSNYTVLWTVAGSPYSRATLPVMVSNPYPDRPVQVKLAVEQPLAHYRTYVGATSVRLAGGESRQVEVMVECIADEPPFADIVPAKELYGVPNVVTAVAVILDDGSDVPEPIGGATIEVRAARGTGFRELDVSRRNASGRVVLMADGSPATGGEVVLATRPGAMTGEIAYRSAVGADGRFAVSTPDFLTLGGGPVAVDVCFTGSGQFGPCREKLVLS